MRIPELTAALASNLNSGSLFAVYINEQGDARKLSLGELISYFQSTVTSPTFEETLVLPNGDFIQALPQDGVNRWLIIRPTGPVSAGQVILPAPSVAVDGQEILINTTLQISTFTIDGNGATAVYRAPSVLAAEGSVKLRYNAQSTSWYAVA